MSMELNNLKYTKGSRNHKVKTLGRGYGSGMGKRSTRGQKGQHARKSGNVRLGFEGGQTPLYRKIPKVGFNNKIFQTNCTVFTTDKILALNLKEVDLSSLIKAKALPKNYKSEIKIIAGKKPINIPLIVKTNKISVGAKKMIELAKGTIHLVNN